MGRMWKEEIEGNDEVGEGKGRERQEENGRGGREMKWEEEKEGEMRWEEEKW